MATGHQNQNCVQTPAQCAQHLIQHTPPVIILILSLRQPHCPGSEFILFLLLSRLLSSPPFR